MILRVIDAVFTTEDEGYRQTMPLLHVFGRDQQYRRHHIEIEAFFPYFCVRQSEWVKIGEKLANDDRVRSVETTDERGRPERAIDGEPLFRVTVREPSDVGDLRELVDDPFEADVLFPTRFLVDFGINQFIEVPDSATDERISAQQVTVDLPEDQYPEHTPPPRVCTYDIEVSQGGDGAPVVSTEGTEQAHSPITAISAHDSFTDEYEVWVLAHQEWDGEDAEAVREAVACPVHVYENPHDVAGMFCEWVQERDFDVLSGWNASGFDHPYLVNYCLNNGVNAVYGLSPVNQVYPMDGDGSWINSSLKGRILVDLMELYDKTVVSELDSKRLAYIADLEDVSVGKLDIEDEISVPDGEPAIDYAWKHDPAVFAQYSLRDTQAAVGINNESKGDIAII